MPLKAVSPAGPMVPRLAAFTPAIVIHIHNHMARPSALLLADDAPVAAAARGERRRRPSRSPSPERRVRVRVEAPPAAAAPHVHVEMHDDHHEENGEDEGGGLEGLGPEFHVAEAPPSPPAPPAAAPPPPPLPRLVPELDVALAEEDAMQTEFMAFGAPPESMCCADRAPCSSASRRGGALGARGARPR